MTHISEETLEEYAMGRLSRYRTERVDEHLASCESCREQLALEYEIRKGVKEAFPAGSRRLAKPAGARVRRKNRP